MADHHRSKSAQRFVRFNMNKKKNIKIKRSKGRLYKKKRSAAKTVLEVIVLAVLAGGLIYVGYSAAGPLIDYITGGGGSDTITSWTPAESIPDSSGSSTENTDPAPSSEETKNQQTNSIGTYLLPQNALTSREALNGALDSAKKSGFGIVLIPLKDADGRLLYSSKIEYIKDIAELTAGTLTAKAIADAAKDKDLVPKAVIPTLLDKLTPDYVEDTGYIFEEGGYSWLDNSAAGGGKRWVDPFLDGTKKYYADIAGELKAAGFEEIVLSELKYPAFHDIDREYLAARNFSADRYKALTALYSICHSASDKAAAVSVNIKDVLSGKGQSFSGTAELLSDKSFSGKVFLTVNLTEFEETLEVADGDPVTLSKDAVKKAEFLIGRASGYLGTNLTIVPIISGEGISAETLAACYKGIAP